MRKTMAQNVDQNSSKPVARHPAGHLLAPFGWAADAIEKMVGAEPTLLTRLFELDVTRMHLIALALAHSKKDSPELGRLLVSGSTRAVTKHVLGRWPTGIKRALGRLPPWVISPENYRHLVEILADTKATKVLLHMRYLSGLVIENLYSLPTSLRRPFILHAIACHDPENRFPDGLRFLVSRGAASSFDALVRDLASATQPKQFISKLKHLVEWLPLPNTLPPMRVGKARRIDQTDTIRSLTNDWQTYPADCLTDIDAGTCAVYIWEDSSAPVACMIRRCGRLGWFLTQLKGRRNANIEAKQIAKIYSAFSEVGIPDYSVIGAIRCMID
jgi:hypothetical protein